MPEAALADPVRIIVAGVAIGLLGAGALALPSFIQSATAEDAVVNATSTVNDLFSDPPFDPSKLRKFDVTVGDSVSTEVQHTSTITKYGFGQKSIVTIVTTPTGTYSSDALTSPSVRYPGIDVAPKWAHGHWSFFTSTSSRGTSTWSSMSSGSFTFLNYSFKPAPGLRT